MIQGYGSGNEKELDLDLTKDLDPPKDLHIEVRVVKPVGKFMTEDGGVINLEPGSTHYLKISDVNNISPSHSQIEHLLKTGHLKPTDT